MPKHLIILKRINTLLFTGNKKKMPYILPISIHLSTTVS